MNSMRKLFLCVLLAACGGSDDEGVDSNEEARRAYLGLDNSIEKSLALGFQGFNMASSANIDPQMATGTVDGTLTITGQVDQGSSDNKGMRLRVGMVGYTDGKFVVETSDGDVEVNLTYDTPTDVTLQPFLQLSLKNIPTGTLTGTLMGDYLMHGDIEGTTTLNLTFAGTLMDAGNGDVVRVPGTTTVTGTATSGDGVFDVDLTL